MKNFKKCVYFFAFILITQCACATKRPQNNNEEITQLTVQQLEDSIHLRAKALTSKRDSLLVKLANDEATLPKDLIHTSDSLTKELARIKLSCDSIQKSFYLLRDTIDEYQVALKDIFGLEGNQAFRVKYLNNTFDCYLVNTQQCNVQLYWKDDEGHIIGSLKNLNNMLKKKEKTVVFAANAGMYTPEHAPQGLFVRNKTTLAAIDKKKEGYGNFYLQPNGIFMVDTNKVASVIRTDQYKDQLSKKLILATQSGPMLVIDSLINTNFRQGSENLNIRNGVGIISPNQIVFIISNQRVNFYDFAEVFRILKCKNALYLDGAISRTYLPELGRFENGGSFGPIIGITK